MSAKLSNPQTARHRKVFKGRYLPSVVVILGSLPRLKIGMDSADGSTTWAEYSHGNGTTSLRFNHWVVEPDISSEGIAVLEDTLELNGGTLKSTATKDDADLSHDGVGHNANHKVDWTVHYKDWWH